VNFRHRLSPRRWLWRPSDALRALGWLALLISLIWGGLACSGSTYTFRLYPFLADQSVTAQRAAVSGADANVSGADATSFALTHAFDIVFDSAAQCANLAPTLFQRGLYAIAVPDLYGAGTVSRAAGSAPYLLLHPQGQEANVTRYDLVDAPQYVDEVEAAINEVAWQTHWETFAMPADAAWACGALAYEGELHFTLEYTSAAPLGCELEVAFLARQPVMGLPFFVSGQVAPLSRYVAPIAPDWDNPPEILTLTPQLIMWEAPAQANGPVYHQLHNGTSEQHSVLLAFNSSRSDYSWAFYSDYAGTQPILGPVTVPAGGSRNVYLKRNTPAAFTGLEFVTIEAMVMSDPLLSAHAIDVFGAADDWSNPVDFSFGYVPLLLKP